MKIFKEIKMFKREIKKKKDIKLGKVKRLR